MLGLEERRHGPTDRVPARYRYLVQSSPWVARITGADRHYEFAREFLRGRRDYSDATSSGKRAIRLWFTLEPGYYEVQEIITSRKTRRYFVRSANGSITEVEREEVSAWLNIAQTEN